MARTSSSATAKAKPRASAKTEQNASTNGAGVGRSGAAHGPAMGSGPADDSSYNLTVEQLAAEVGMSVRNIRNHHTRGLLPPPEVRARVGFYGADHVARLRLILDLQADGFNLAAIERLLSGSGGA